MNTFRGICIHSHFYQPPREDPWLDAVLRDPTAEPYHDWNECIYDQCYKPNMAARLLDSNGRIAHISNNYRYMSFNIGPTLHKWIAVRAPVLAEGILKADANAESELGAGGAIAQAYNHIIMPLACERDIRTQVKWGVADFARRFGRKPEGMWLPETAVDTQTLEALAAEGINFTILAPHQCAATREPGGSWTDTPGGAKLDVTKPYVMKLPSGKSITLIFYLGSVAHDIAFGGLLNNGDQFAESLIGKIQRYGEPRLLTIATDGETYGHHHRFGEMALARAAQVISQSPDVILTNIAAFLKLHPAKHECRIAERTSWSCAHGVERWRSNCGCHTGGEAWWNQAWRAPLRDALDKLRDKIDEVYEREMAHFCDSPWQLRDEALALYPDDYGNEPLEEIIRQKRLFLEERCGTLKQRDTVRALTLIDAQKMRMFMYTSCGWFFNDVAGIETRQIMAYAIRAAEHTKNVSGVDFQSDFLNDLRRSRGNTSELATAYDVVTRCVIPNKKQLRDIAAMASLMNAENRYYSFGIERDSERYKSAGLDMDISTISVTDLHTSKNWTGGAAVITTGGLDDVCRLTEKPLPDPKSVWKNFYVGDIFSISKFLEGHFELGPWHLTELTADDRYRTAQERTRNVEKENVEYAHARIRENQRLLVQLHMMQVESTSFLTPIGKLVYENMLENLAKNAKSILDLLESGSQLENILNKAQNIGINPKTSVLSAGMEEAFYDNLIKADFKNDKITLLKLSNLWRRAMELDIEIDKWRLQNAMWEILEAHTSVPHDILLEFAGELGFALPGR